MGCMCGKCGKMMGLLVLIIGVLFLLRDVNVWNFWNIQWWTVAFILIGCAGLCCGCCPECKTMAKKK
jgi:hypothetical protein